MQVGGAQGISGNVRKAGVVKRTRITANIVFLEPDDMRHFKACAGLLVEGTRKLVIDANMGSDTAAFLREANPEAAILSHYHLDHGVWGTVAQQHAGAAVFVPSGEERYLTDLDYFLEHTAAPHGLASAWKTFSVDDCGYRELEDAIPYDPGDSFSDRRVSIQCLDTKGHSPAHRSFYFPEQNVLFSGDLGVDRFGPWYGWVECHLLQLVEAILTLRDLPTAVLLTSHGGMLTSGIREAWDRALVHLIQREDAVRRRLDDGQEPAVIIDKGIFFPQKNKAAEPMRSFLYMWDTVMFRHHRDVIANGGLRSHFPELRTLA
jgi:glyoxylase-like metal-dependent hydrolase (beta-lactamase superfamily II)